MWYDGSSVVLWSWFMARVVFECGLVVVVRCSSLVLWFIVRGSWFVSFRCKTLGWFEGGSVVVVWPKGSWSDLYGSKLWFEWPIELASFRLIEICKLILFSMYVVLSSI